MPPPANPRDPWRRSRVGELQDQLLPRWFVVLCLALVPIAVGAIIAAFVVFAPADVPVAARRPPPADGLTSDVGDFVVGRSQPVPYAGACRRLDGVRIAGTPADQQTLRLGLAALCNTTLPPAIEDRVARFAAAGGVVRFAQFERTGVDSAARLRPEPRTILLNAKLQRTDPLWIAPLVAHDAVLLGADPTSADAALQARRAEDLVCDRILSGRRESRGCEDAEALLALPDPLAALREAGYR